MHNIPRSENKCQRVWLKLAPNDCLKQSLQSQQVRFAA